MESYHGICFGDVFFKLIGFDDKLEVYTYSSEVTPHMDFYTSRGGYSISYVNNRCGYSSRGRGQTRVNYRGRGSYSTRGRDFY